MNPPFFAFYPPLVSELFREHPLKLLSIFVCVLIVAGILNRRRRRIHIPLMLSAFAIDLGIVLYLEITRHVVESIPQREVTPLLIVHIIISVIVLILYGVQVYTGIQNARGRRSRWHRQAAWAFVILRFGNLFTSFLVT